MDSDTQEKWQKPMKQRVVWTEEKKNHIYFKHIIKENERIEQQFFY